MATLETYTIYVQTDIEIGGMEFCYWLTKIGKSRATGYRWRSRKWVKTENIDGKLFITQKEIDRFWMRAQTVNSQK